MKIREILLLLEYVEFKKGHKNSKGEEAPWCILSHAGERVISSHKTKDKAEEHLKQINIFKHR